MVREGDASEMSTRVGMGKGRHRESESGSEKWHGRCKRGVVENEQEQVHVV
jgi:hypothetical protein